MKTVWPSFNLKNVSRGKGTKGREHSSVAAAAYNSRKRLKDRRTGRVHRYNRKNTDLVLENILTPSDAPNWAADRLELWNKVEEAERRKDARTAKTIRAAMVREIPPEMWEELMQDFAAPLLAKGLIVDYAIHVDKDNHNPHCHILLTTRCIDKFGFAKKKYKAANDKEFLEALRKAWIDASNKKLAAIGADVRAEYRSFKRLGIAKKASKHRGRLGQKPERITPEMKTITFRDRREYPNLVERDDWPPVSKMPAPDMTTQEAEELEKYWDHKLEQERKPEREHAKPASEKQQQFADWRSEQEEKRTSRREQAERTKDFDTPVSKTEDRLESPEIDLSMYEEEMVREARLDATEKSIARREEEKELRREAMWMFPTRSENERLQAARKHSFRMRQHVSKVVINERVDYLKILQKEKRQKMAWRDEVAYYKKHRPEGQSRLEQFFNRKRVEQELKELPVPGPDGRPIHPKHLEEAQNRMLAEYHTENPTPQQISQSERDGAFLEKYYDNLVSEREEEERQIEAEKMKHKR